MNTDPRPIAVYHEHPDWFRPLFAEMDRRGLPYVRLDPARHSYDPGANDAPYSLLFNRMSPSAYLRGGVQGIFFTLAYLAHLERLGVPVVNGRRAFTVETSKALQLTLLESLGLPYPRARVINHPSKAVSAAEGLRFPVVVKANVGGSGAGIVRYRQAGRPGPRRRRGPAQPRRRSHRPGAGIHPGPRRLHHPRRDARRQVPLRHQASTRPATPSISAPPTSASAATASSCNAPPAPSTPRKAV